MSLQHVNGLIHLPEGCLSSDSLNNWMNRRVQTPDSFDAGLTINWNHLWTFLPTLSLWELSSNTLLQECPSWLNVTENSVTIIWVNIDRAPWVMIPVIRLTFPKSTCSHSWGLLFWGKEDIRSTFRFWITTNYCQILLLIYFAKYAALWKVYATKTNIDLKNKKIQFPFS